MGCVFNKQSTVNKLSLSPNSQRLFLLRCAMQNSRYTKNIVCPELTADEQTKVLTSSKLYFNYLEGSPKVDHFTDFLLKHPQIFNAYFRKVPTEHPKSSLPPATDDNEEIKPDYARHIQLSRAMIKSLVENIAAGNLENIQESLRRVGAIHAESWITSKDMLLFEDSFMFSLDKSDPTMDPKLRALWRKIIKYILHSVTLGINNHYEKLNYVLGSGRKKYYCFENKLPIGVDPRSFDSLRKLASLVKAQAND